MSTTTTPDLALPTGSARRGSAATRARRTAKLAARLLGLAAVLTLVVCYLLGFRAEAVLSGSMQPTLHVGDLVISKKEHVDQLHRGDIVTFATDHGQTTTTHRVMSVVRSGTRLKVVTKGDANTATEQWLAPPTGTVGVSTLHVRYAGWPATMLSRSWARPALITLAAAIGLIALLVRLWRPDRTQPAPDRR